jgi:hypothetical protein
MSNIIYLGSERDMDVDELDIYYSLPAALRDDACDAAILAPELERVRASMLSEMEEHWRSSAAHSRVARNALKRLTEAVQVIDTLLETPQQRAEAPPPSNQD